MYFASPAYVGAGDVVNNPGTATFIANGGGFLNLSGTNSVLPSTATPTQCNDGVNNDVAVDDPTKQQDLNIDFDGGASHGVTPATPVDAQCNAGGGFTAAADDSEIAPGNQPRPTSRVREPSTRTATSPSRRPASASPRPTCTPPPAVPSPSSRRPPVR